MRSSWLAVALLAFAVPACSSSTSSDANGGAGPGGSPGAGGASAGASGKGGGGAKAGSSGAGATTGGTGGAGAAGKGGASAGAAGANAGTGGSKAGAGGAGASGGSAGTSAGAMGGASAGAAGSNGGSSGSSGACPGVPSPTITTTSPAQVIASPVDTDVKVTGTGFVAATTATFDKMPAKVAFVSATELTVTLPAAALGAIGNFDLVVTNPPSCGTSAFTIAVRSPASLNPAGWPRHHHDNQNTSATSSVVAASPKVAWKKFTSMPSSGVLAEGGGFWSGPVVGRPGKLEADVVFVGAPDGTIFSFGQDGTLVYHFTGVGPNVYGIDGVAAIRADGTLYVGVSDAILYAIKPDGTKLWSYTTGSTSDGSAAIAEDGTILYSSDDNNVYALTPDGVATWSSPAAGEVDSAIATSKQEFGTASPIVVFLGGQNGWYCLDGATGKEKWHVAATGARGAGVSSPVVDKDGSIFGVDSGGLAVHIDGGGKVLWQKQIAAGGAGATPALVGDHLYVIGFDGVLRALKTSDGSTIWQADVKGTVPSQGELPSPVVDGAGDVFVYSPDGNLYRFAADGTAKPTLAVAPPLAEFVMPQAAIGFDGTIYISGSDGNLYALK